MQENNIGVNAIKAISKGRWKEASRYTTWYEPLDDQELVDQAVWFTLSQNGVTTYSLPCDVRLWPLVLDAVKRYRKLDEEQVREIVKTAKEKEILPLFPELR